MNGDERLLRQSPGKMFMKTQGPAFSSKNLQTAYYEI